MEQWRQGEVGAGGTSVTYLLYYILDWEGPDSDRPTRNGGEGERKGESGGEWPERTAGRMCAGGDGNGNGDDGSFIVV